MVRRHLPVPRDMLPYLVAYTHRVGFAIMPPHFRREITFMKILLTLAFGLILTVTAAAQHKSASPVKSSAPPAASAQTLLEAKIRKAWEDYKNKNKEGFAAILANNFGEVTNDADAIAGKDEEVSEMDHFNLTSYELGDFKLRPVGNAGAVMTYIAKYSATYDNTPLQMKAVYGEVWTKSGGDWTLLWVQETKIK